MTKHVKLTAVYPNFYIQPGPPEFRARMSVDESLYRNAFAGDRHAQDLICAEASERIVKVNAARPPLIHWHHLQLHRHP